MAPAKQPTEAQIKKELQRYIAIKTKMEKQGKVVSTAERNLQKAANIRDQKLKIWKQTYSQLQDFESKLKSKGQFSAVERGWSEYLRIHPNFFDRYP